MLPLLVLLFAVLAGEVRGSAVVKNWPPDLHPAAGPRLLAAAEEAAALLASYAPGYTVEVVPVTGGRRTEAEQARLMEQGTSKAAGPTAPHVQGRAVDLLVRDPAGRPLWSPSSVYRPLGDIAARHGLTWGGSWKPLDANGVGWDPYHLEVPADQLGGPA